MKLKKFGIALMNEITILFGIGGFYLSENEDYFQSIGDTFLLSSSSVLGVVLISISILAFVGLYYNKQILWAIAFSAFNGFCLLIGLNYLFAGRILGALYLFVMSFLSITREMRFSASQILIKPRAIVRKTREQLKREYFDGD